MPNAVFYHYFELDETYRDNFLFFLNTAINQFSNYYIYISGSCTIDLPNSSNIKYFHIKNMNNDFGAIVEFANQIDKEFYDSYLFVNCSVRGPFKVEYHNQPWQEVFLSQLEPGTGLVASSVNILPLDNYYSHYFAARYPYPGPFVHAQTTAYALSRDAFKILAASGFYDCDERLSKDDVICRYEILLSQIILKSGHSIASILPAYGPFSNLNREMEFSGTAPLGDLFFKNAFYGRTLSPYEIMFIKTNRDIISDRELASYTFTCLHRFDSLCHIDAGGRELFLKAFERLQAEEPFAITVDNLRAILAAVKFEHPHLARELMESLMN